MESKEKVASLRPEIRTPHSPAAAAPCSPDRTAPRIRIMNREDLPGVATLERALFAEPWSEALLTAEWESAVTHGLVLEQPAAADRTPGNGAGREPDASAVPEQPAAADRTPDAPRMMGYAFFTAVAGEAELHRIGIDQRAQGQGLGAILLRRVIGAAKGADVTEMYLEVRETNASARRLYTSAGFEEVGRRPDYYGPGRGAIVMRLEM